MIHLDELLVGERGRAHDVLASSLPGGFAQSIAHHLDLPGQLPPGFQLENYVSGFPLDDSYVFARTCLDTTADRQGMVFSHALVAKARDLAELNHVEPLFRQLAAQRPVDLSARPTSTDTSPPRTVPRPPPQLCDMIATQADGPVVIGDPMALEPAVIALWPSLLPSLRRVFRFRLSFAPEEHNLAQFHLVAVPPQVVTRWPAERVLDLKSTLQTPRTPAGRFLHRNAEQDLNSFLTDLRVDCQTFETLSLSSRAFELFTLDPSFEATLAATRLIGSLQPDPQKGSPIKRLLLQRLAATPGPDSVAQFLSLRNLDLSPFPDDSAFLANLALRFQEFFDSNGDADALLALAQSAYDPSQSTDDWRLAVRTALSNLSSTGSYALAPAIWQILATHTDAGLFLLDQLCNVRSMDRALAESLQAPVETDSRALSGVLIDFGFVLAEAEILIRRHNGLLTAALSEACDRDQHRDAAATHIISRLSPAERISAALSIDDPLVLSAAAEAVVSAPTLLYSLDMRDHRVQQVWNRALQADPDAWQTTPNVDELRDRVFNCLFDGELSAELLERLTSSPLANLLDHPRRAEVWPLIPAPCRTACLQATATAWITSLPERAHEPDYPEPEQQLASAIASPSLNPNLQRALAELPFVHVISVFAANSELPAALFHDPLQTFCDSVTASDAVNTTRAARLVAARNWRDLTRSIWQSHRHDPLLRAFFEVCADHLDSWDRLRYAVRRPFKDDLYRFLVDVACELYPVGPMESELWARAKGDPSRLDASGSGRRQWEGAVRKLRYGGRIRAADLLAVMLDDYPLNEKLQYLATEL